MPTTKEYVEFVCEQIKGVGFIRFKKMFGEYMVYVNDKPLLLVCDGTVFVKMHESIAHLMEQADRGYPYQGAKKHYILDIDDSLSCKKVIDVLERNIPVSKSRRKTAN